MHELNIHCLNSKIASMITIKYSLQLQYAYNPQPWQRHQILFGISFNWKKWIENVWNQCIQRFLKHQRPLPMPILLSTKGFWWYASPTNQHWKFELWMEMKGLNFKRTFECSVYLDMHTSKMHKRRPSMSNLLYIFSLNIVKYINSLFLLNLDAWISLF